MRISEPPQEGGSSSSSSGNYEQRDQGPQPISEDVDDDMGTDDAQQLGGGEQEELKDAVMSVVADDKLAEWLVNGTIAGINSKEEEEEQIIKRALMNYCPGVESHVTEIHSPPRVTTMAERFKLIPG